MAGKQKQVRRGTAGEERSRFCAETQRILDEAGMMANGVNVNPFEDDEIEWSLDEDPAYKAAVKALKEASQALGRAVITWVVVDETSCSPEVAKAMREAARG